MKRKTIEGIPFLGLPGTRRKKDIKFIGVTAVKNVAGEQHFFLEVYRNGRAYREVPVARVVLTTKDFGTYFPEDGTWSKAKIEESNYYYRLAWEEVRTTTTDKIKQNALYSPDDLARIKGFFKGVKIWSEGKWWEYIKHAQDNITNHKQYALRKRKQEKRQQALQDRIANTPKLQEQEILSWADEALFHQKHFIYYSKKGRKAQICCSACGGVMEGAWKAGQSYESMFEKHIDEPRDKMPGTCPMCGAGGIYKPCGRAKEAYPVRAYVFKADRYKETGAVFRYVILEKSWHVNKKEDGSGRQVMTGAYEKLEGIELARTYISGGRVQTDYCKYNPYEGKDFWDDCNLSGFYSLRMNDAPLYPGFEESLKGTEAQYSAIGLYAEAAGGVNARDYMKRYVQTPQLEMLVKLKLYGVVKSLLLCRYGIVKNEEAKSLDGFLGIRKEKQKFLMDKQGDLNILNVLQMEKELGQNWTDRQVAALSEINAGSAEVQMVLEIMTLQKVLNLIAKYAGCRYGTGCTDAEAQLRATAGLYFDYLHMRRQLGYDMANTVYQRPRDLEAAHGKMVAEINKEAWDKRNRETEERFPLIRKNYRKLRLKFLYEDSRYIIRPARSAEEIVNEGRILHHCVGGDNYLRNHNKQKSIILMLRFRDRPEKPYVTVEIQEDTIVQWYGAYDRKPDKDNIDRWLKAYQTRLKCRQEGSPEDGKQGAAVAG